MKSKISDTLQEFAEKQFKVTSDKIYNCIYDNTVSLHENSSLLSINNKILSNMKQKAWDEIFDGLEKEESHLFEQVSKLRDGLDKFLENNDGNLLQTFLKASEHLTKSFNSVINNLVSVSEGLVKKYKSFMQKIDPQTFSLKQIN